MAEGIKRGKSGTPPFMMSNRQEVLAKLSFTHLGIFRLSPEKVQSAPLI